MKERAHHGAGRNRPRNLTDAHCYAAVLTVLMGGWIAAALLLPRSLAKVEVAKLEVDLRFAEYEPARSQPVR